MRVTARRPPWWLADGAAISRAFPETLVIPPLDARNSLATGHRAQLQFVGDRRLDGEEGQPVERLWVRVEGLSPGGQYLGRLEEQPTLIRGLIEADEVLFTGRHVIAVGDAPADAPPSVAEAAPTDGAARRRRWGRRTR